MEDSHASSAHSLDDSLAGDRLRVHVQVPVRHSIQGLAGAGSSTTCDRRPHRDLTGPGLGKGAGTAAMTWPKRRSGACPACGKLAQVGSRSLA